MDFGGVVCYARIMRQAFTPPFHGRQLFPIDQTHKVASIKTSYTAHGLSLPSVSSAMDFFLKKLWL